MIMEILKEAENRELSREEAVELLKIDNQSDEFYELIKIANRMTRREYGNKAYVFSQIGLNAEPCTMNCKFCSMAKSNYVMDGEFRKTMADIEDLKKTARDVIEAGTHDLFLMTTADYPVDEFLAIGKALRAEMPDHVRLVANIGDFDEDTAKKLKHAGFTGV